MSNAAFQARAEAVPDGSAAARRGLAGCLLALTFLLTQVPSIPELCRLVITATGPSGGSHSSGGRTPAHQLDILFSLVSGVVVWAMAAWLILVAIAAISAALLSGSRQAGAMTCLHRLAPPALRGIFVAALGIGSIAALSGCAPLDAGYGSAAGTTTVTGSVADLATSGGLVAVELEWPTGGSSSVGLDVDWPAESSGSTPTGTPAAASVGSTARSATAAAAITPTPAATITPAPATTGPATTGPTATAAPATTAPPAAASTTAGPAGPVTVQPGDSLWSITEARLPPHAGAAEIDAGWRAWYSANRTLIGDDPDLILPGWQLIAPPIPPYQ